MTSEANKAFEAYSRETKMRQALVWLDTEPNAPKHFTKAGNIEAREFIRTALTRPDILQAVDVEKVRDALSDVEYCQEQCSSDNPYVPEKCQGLVIRSGETIRALLAAVLKGAGE